MRTGERREKAEESFCVCSVTNARESDFIFIFLRVFRTEFTYLDAENFAVSKFCKVFSQ